MSEWGIHRPFSTPAAEKVCCGSSSSGSSWRERQTGRSAGSRTFESQAPESIWYLTHPAPGQRVFSFKTGPSNGVRDLTGRDSSLDHSCGLWSSQVRPTYTCGDVSSLWSATSLDSRLMGLFFRVIGSTNIGLTLFGRRRGKLHSRQFSAGSFRLELALSGICVTQKCRKR